MKKLAFLGGAVVVSVFALSHAPLNSQAADHLDSAVTLSTKPMADINDVYVWMTSDSATVNLALTVSPFDNGTRNFGPDTVYAFHLSSRPMYGAPGMEYKVICKFASNTDGECWVTNPAGATVDYVKGDFSAVAGKAAGSGKFRVFAGRRSDPFFFNFGGFKRAVGAAITLCGGTSCPPPGGAGVDASGCLKITKTSGDTVRNLVKTAPVAPLSATNPCPPNQLDCFAGYNVMAIVIQVDKTLLLNGADKIISAWASTHTGS